MRRARVLVGSVLVLAALQSPVFVSDTLAEIRALSTQAEPLLKMRQLAAKLSTSGYGKIQSANGDCLVARANPSSKTVWAARLSCSGDNGALAGFTIGQLTSTMPLSGVKVVATIEVTHLVGTTDFSTKFGKAGSAAAHYGKRISQPGTYTISTGPFDLQANQPYEAGATVYVGKNNGALAAIEAKITEIKWDF